MVVVDATVIDEGVQALDEFVPHPSNPKDHSLDEIAVSMRRFGFTEAVLVDDRTGLTTAGHGRIETLTMLRDRGEEPPGGIEVDVEGRWLVPTQWWTSTNDIEAKAYVVASNRLVERGGWKLDPLTAILTELDDADALDGIGFDHDSLDDMLADLAADDEPDDPDPEPDDKGSILDRFDIGMGEPRHQPKHGDVWDLGQHVLIVADLIDDHRLWVPHLTPDAKFLPYPSMFAMFGTRFAETPLVFLQPVTYLAGHLLDKIETATGVAPTLRENVR